MTEKVDSAVKKSFAILSTLTTFGTGASLTELSTITGYPTSTVHRLLNELVETGCVVQDPATRLHWVGPAITRIAASRPQDDLLRAVARGALVNLSAECGETAFLSTRHGFHLLYVDCVLSTKRLRTWGEVGTLGPLHATSQGKAILAALPDDELVRTVHQLPLEAITPRSIVQPEALVAHLREAARLGFTVNDEEHDVGTVAIGTSVEVLTPALNSFTASISISSPTIRLTLDQLVEQHVPQLLAAKAAIEQRFCEIAERRQVRRVR